MSGKDLLKATAEKIGSEVQKEREANALALTNVSLETKAFFAKNAELGSENVQGARLPYLKVSESNSRNELMNGRLSTAGNFYYMPTKSEFPEVEVSLMTVSRGFYTKQQNSKTQAWEIKFNQLVGGMMLNSLEPFVMFATGTRWLPMNEFVKSIKPFTKHKETPVPMFAFRVKLSLEEIVTDNGRNNVVKYELVRNDEQQIELINDRQLLTDIGSRVIPMSESIQEFIDANEVDKDSGEYMRDKPKTAVDVEVKVASPVEQQNAAIASQDAESEDMPF